MWMTRHSISLEAGEAKFHCDRVSPSTLMEKMVSEISLRVSGFSSAQVCSVNWSNSKMSGVFKSHSAFHRAHRELSLSKKFSEWWDSLIGEN